MKFVISHIHTYLLLYLGIIIHMLFYVSALDPGWLNVFFSGPATHYNTPGVDFYQLVRGAWAWWHGGSLAGAPLAHGAVYAPVKYFVNGNAYHPLLTLLLGSFLMLFSPATSYAIWIWIKLCIDALVLSYFWWQVVVRPVRIGDEIVIQQEKYGQFAMFLLLANASAYLELAAGQFHFLLNMALLLFLVMIHKNEQFGATLAYAASLLIKPIGLLFLPALAFKKHWRMAFVALDLAVAMTIPFVLSRSGMYYVTNLWNNLTHHPHFGPSQILTLNALLRFSTNWPEAAYQTIQYACLALVMLLSASKRIHVNKAIFFVVVYFLFFYDLLYEYDYSTLAYVGAVCVLTLPEFQTRLSRIALLLLCLPSCFVVLHLLNIGMIHSAEFGDYPSVGSWRLVVLSKLLPVALLCGSVLAGDVAFWRKWLRFVRIRKQEAGPLVVSPRAV